MTIPARDRVNVMFACWGKVSGIHAANIESAVRIRWVTGGAGGFGGLAVSPMAIATAQAFVNAGRCAIIRTAELAAGSRSMTLRADPLTSIARNLHRPIPLRDGGNRQAIR